MQVKYRRFRVLKPQKDLVSKKVLVILMGNKSKDFSSWFEKDSFSTGIKTLVFLLSNVESLKVENKNNSWEGGIPVCVNKEGFNLTEYIDNISSQFEWVLIIPKDTYPTRDKWLKCLLGEVSVDCVLSGCFWRYSDFSMELVGPYLINLKEVKSLRLGDNLELDKVIPFEELLLTTLLVKGMSNRIEFNRRIKVGNEDVCTNINWYLFCKKDPGDSDRIIKDKNEFKLELQKIL